MNRQETDQEDLQHLRHAQILPEIQELHEEVQAGHQDCQKEILVGIL